MQLDQQGRRPSPWNSVETSVQPCWNARVIFGWLGTPKKMRLLWDPRNGQMEQGDVYQGIIRPIGDRNVLFMEMFSLNVGDLEMGQ